jgi:hypothetical protein
MVAEPGRMAGFTSFVDTWTGSLKSGVELREYSGLGLRRVYVGLETGDPDLHSRLGKPADPETAVELVHSLRGAGIDVGVIVLVGVGGEPFFAAHAKRTAQVLTRMELGPTDLVYFSDYLDGDLTPRRRADQSAWIQSDFQPADPAHPPTTARYDLGEFVY